VRLCDDRAPPEAVRVAAATAVLAEIPPPMLGGSIAI
jgi:hypothetical protein